MPDRELLSDRGGRDLLAELHDEQCAHDELHGCWECGTSDMRGNVCAEHEDGRRPSRDFDQPKET